jgi:hypothetical protein
MQRRLERAIAVPNHEGNVVPSSVKDHVCLAIQIEITHGN